MKGNSGILSAWSKVQRILDFRGVTQKGIYKFPGVTLLHQRDFISFNNETYNKLSQEYKKPVWVSANQQFSLNN